MPSFAHDAYLESRVLSAGPVELVRLLYQGALESVEKARRFLQEGDIKSRSGQIGRAYGILAELSGSLDHEKGGPLSRNLVEIYDYLQRRLLEANQNQDDVPLAEAAGLLETLLEAWGNCDAESLQWQNPLAASAQYAHLTAEYEARSWSL